MISIVDDDAIVRDATLNLVRSLGFTGATFASAEEFLESDRVNNTACLIADVQLPGLSGIELQTRLRTQGNPTPVIFITGFPEARIRAQALDAGAIGFLSKPFDAEMLIDCLDKALCPDCARPLNECPATAAAECERGAAAKPRLSETSRSGQGALLKVNRRSPDC